MTQITLDDVVERLEMLGYKYDEATDSVLINYLILENEMFIKNFCNIGAIPNELKYVEIELVSGKFLENKYSTGKLNDENFSITQAISSIKEGDTSVSFGNSNTQETTSSFIKKLINSSINELISFRKFKW
jgi:hypothetical protein